MGHVKLDEFLRVLEAHGNSPKVEGDIIVASVAQRGDPTQPEDMTW